MSSGGDDQSEDGELRHSPESKTKLEDVLDFSLSEEDADTADSLDIKPPQAARLTHSSGGASRSKRRERIREGRSRHGRSDRRRDQERGRLHREKHHRERSGREREAYRDKEHFRERETYRDKDMYSKDAFNENRDLRYPPDSALPYKDNKYMDIPYRGDLRRDESKYAHEGSTSRYDKRLLKDSDKYVDMRYMQEQEPQKLRRYEEQKSQMDRKSMKSSADQTLDDLRERLLDKRRIKDGDEVYGKRYEKETKRKVREVPSPQEDPEAYVREIIDLSTGDDGNQKRSKVHRKEQDWSGEEEAQLEKKVKDAEREEQELRKEKLLEAEREIARQKEQYKLDRERRHQRRQERQEVKRRLQEEQEQEHRQRKRQRMSGELDQYKDKDLSIVTVSDNSSEASSEQEDDEDLEENHSDSEGSDSNERNSESSSERASESEESVRREDRSDDERIRERSKYKNDSPRSQSRSRSATRSPKDNNDQLPDEDQEKPKDPTEKQAEPQQPQIKKLDDDLPPYFPAIQGCRSVEEFKCLNRIEEGTYGVVYRALDKRTEEIVALKRLKMEKEKEGFPITSLREINTLLKAQHPNIVTVREIVVGSNMDKIYIVMDYVEHDLKSLMETMRSRRQVFVPGEVKCLLQQLLSAVAHLHDNWILHRDLKTSNLLLSHRGILKVGDFGLAREYGSPLKAYTPIVVTLWYRAPELLLCCKEYSTPIDMWSVGCIFAEFVLMRALFSGQSEAEQLNLIFKDLGTPNEKIWPGYNELPAVKKMKFADHPAAHIRSRFGMLTDLGQGLLQRFLTYDPAQRITAEDALKHGYFSEAPLPIDPAMFPTWPAKSELGHRKAVAASPKPPSGGREYKQLGDGDEDSALGFHMGGSAAGDPRRLAMGGGFSLKF